MASTLTSFTAGDLVVSGDSDGSGTYTDNQATPITLEELTTSGTVILAENLACESYLDMGNRDFFAEAGVVALAGVPNAARTHADFCRPFAAEGPVVEAVRARLAERAQAARRAA